MAEETVPAGGWQVLGPRDAAAIYALHLESIAGIADRSTVKPEKPAFFEGLLAGRGIILGARHEGGLIAYGVLQHDLAADDDPRRLLGLAVGEPLAKLAGVSVRPGERGQGWQRSVTRARIALAGERGFGHLFATSAPGNPVSWGNLMDEGFAIAGLVEKYGGLKRFVLHRAPGRRPAPQRWLPASALSEISTLLGEGLVGVAFRQKAGGTPEREIGFAPPDVEVHAR